jgi:hypothetical protein
MIHVNVLIIGLVGIAVGSYSTLIYADLVIAGARNMDF